MLSGGVANLQKAEDLGGTIPDSVGTKQADARMKTTALCFLHRIYHDYRQERLLQVNFAVNPINYGPDRQVQ